MLVAVVRVQLEGLGRDEATHIEAQSHTQLWNSNGVGELNPHPLSPATVYTNPDFISNGFSVINAGPTYSVQAGEFLLLWAAICQLNSHSFTTASYLTIDGGEPISLPLVANA